MSYKSDFVKSVPNFMNKYTLYLPGSGQDSGKLNFNKPQYQAFQGKATPIKIDAQPTRAAWRPHLRDNHLKLLLENSQDYKDGGQGFYEQSKAQLIQEAQNSGASAGNAKDYARSALRRAGVKVENSEWFECYFLPWSNGRYIYMQLDTEADYFFTATMNGCSFLVSGDAKRPTVAHINTAQPGDDNPGTVVTKATIRGRYGDAVNLSPLNRDKTALLSKYKPAETNMNGVNVTFKGSAQKYKMDDNELANINDPDILRHDDGHGHQVFDADLNCFVVGARGSHGWEFYYQRSAVAITRFAKTKHTPETYANLNFGEKVGMKLGGKLSYYTNTTQTTASMNHKLTSCTKLAFPGTRATAN